MKYTVIWSDFSEKQLDEIFEYYCDEVNKRTAKKIVKLVSDFLTRVVLFVAIDENVWRIVAFSFSINNF